jgi:hypothetical protein
MKMADDRDSKLLWNVGQYPPGHIVQRSERQPLSHSLPSGPEISKLHAAAHKPLPFLDG